jgi:DNA primase
VASSGTALTVEQIRLIKRFTPNITIIYDGDEAGIKASFRGIDLVLEEGLNVRVLLLPDGEDPDSFSKKHSSSELAEFISQNEKDFISFKTGLLLKDALTDPVKKAGLISDIVRSIAVIPGAINRSVYIRECSSLMDVDERVLYSEVNKIRKGKLEQKWRSERIPEAASREIPVQPLVPSFVEEVYSEYEEREIIYFLLKFGNEKLRIPEENQEIKVAEFIIREIQNDNLKFENLVYKKVFEDTLDLIEKGLSMEEKYFIYHEDKKIQELAVDIYSSRYELSKVWRRKETYIELPGENLGMEVPKALLAYKNRIITKAIKDMLGKITTAVEGNNHEQVSGLQRQHMNLKEIQKLISKKLGERTIISY